MQEKRVLWDERVRLVPKGFSWVDHRLVRDGYIQRCDPDALALYLLLVSVSDANGLSYYSDKSICRLIQLPRERLDEARQKLIRADLVAYEAPLYQVLSIPERRPA
jgi:hypothetical protein